MNNKESSRLEDNPKDNKLGFLPLSPPAHQKSPQDSHFHSSSSPVGRPPPLSVDTDIAGHNDRLFQALSNLASQEGESSSSTPVTRPNFPILDQAQEDFVLDSYLTSNGDKDADRLPLFSDWPKNNNTNG